MTSADVLRYREGIALMEAAGCHKIPVNIHDLRRYLAAWECLVRQRARVQPENKPE